MSQPKVSKSSYVRKDDILIKQQDIAGKNAELMKDIQDIHPEFDFEQTDNDDYIQSIKLKTKKMTNLLQRRVRMIRKNNARIQKLQQRLDRNKPQVQQGKKSYYVRKDDIPEKIEELNKKFDDTLKAITENKNVVKNVKIINRLRFQINKLSARKVKKVKKSSKKKSTSKIESTSALEGSFKTYVLPLESNDPFTELINRRQEIAEIVLSSKPGVNFKVRFIVNVTLEQTNAEGVTEEISGHFQSGKFMLHETSTNTIEFIVDLINRCMAELDAYLKNKSAWTVKQGENLTIQFAEYNASNAKRYFKTPDFIELKRCCVNVKNTDDDCFKYAFMAAVNPIAKNAQRPEQYDDMLNNDHYEKIIRERDDKAKKYGDSFIDQKLIKNLESRIIRINPSQEDLDHNAGITNEIFKVLDTQPDNIELIDRLKSQLIPVNLTDEQAKNNFEINQQITAMYQLAEDKKAEWYAKNPESMQIRRWRNAIKIVPESYQTPMPICEKAFTKFERMNHVALFIWEYTDEDGLQKVFTSRRSVKDNYRPVDLLIISQSENGEVINRHYIAVKKYNTLLCHVSRNVKAKHFCRRCNINYQTAERLASHNCDETQTIVMPSTINNIYKFHNHKNKIPVPFVIYGDFEAILQNIQAEKEEEEDTKKRMKKVKMNTTHDQEHIPYSFALKVVCSADPSIKFDLILRKGNDVMAQFWDELDQIKKRIDSIIQDIKPIKMTKEDEKDFESANDCRICENPLGMRYEHRSNYVSKEGKFLGKCCSGCRDVSAGNYKMDKDELNRYFKASRCCRCQGEFPHKNNKYVGKSVGMLGNKFQGPVCRKCQTPHEGNILLTAAEQAEAENMTNCYVCRKKFKLVRDAVKGHCHITGKYRGAAHNQCNIKRRRDIISNRIPVVFHNLRGYDSHLIIKAFNRMGDADGRNITCIPNNSEKYMSFNVGKFKFIDSAQFLLGSLENLVESMKNGRPDNINEDTFSEFHHMKEWLSQKNTSPHEVHRPGCSLDTMKLIISKGIYPYGFTGKYSSSLPHIKHFYDDLNKKSCPKADYEHAKKVWKHFKCQNFENYHDLYLSTDVLLLTDVFENFRKIGMKNYQLDPVHYISLPGYSNDCLLKFTKQQIELLTDLEDYKFFEESIRGGISMIGQRLGLANNKYMNDYNPEEASKYLAYLDANNLYGGAMMCRLPIGGFKWLNNIQEWFADDCQKIKDIPEDSPKGYHFEVDIHTPEDLHDYFDQYPLCPEAKVVTNDMIGDYGAGLLYKVNSEQGNDMEKVLLKNQDKTPKLIISLLPKTNYKVSHEYLKYCLKKGMVITKIHRVIEYDTKAWMAPYIQFNTAQRAKCTSTCEKDFYKLMNNAVFGKSMENVRNRVEFKFCKTRKEFLKLTEKPQFNSVSQFNNNLLGVMMDKRIVNLNKPIFVGACILDLSKLTMARFHYDYIKVKYPGDQSKLLFTDTDSLAYEIETNDFYQDIKPDSDEFDFSDYPKNHFLHSDANKKVVNKFKDEANSKIITKFVGLRSKMYAYVTKEAQGVSESKKCKGIKKSVVKTNLKFNNYYETLINESKMMTSMTTLRSYNHSIHTITQTKIALSAYDNKRFMLNAVESRSHGHYKNQLRKK